MKLIAKLYGLLMIGFDPFLSNNCVHHILIIVVALFVSTVVAFLSYTTVCLG